jgi:hypothetical protein
MRQMAFSDMPDHARVFIHGLSRPLDGAETDRFLERVDTFLDGWVAHGEPVSGARELRDGRFLIIAADEDITHLSGCSIDSLVRAMKELEAAFHLSLLDSSPVWYRGPEGLERVTRDEFGRRIEAGRITPDTLVFDNTVSDLGTLRRGGWEKPFHASWHARLWTFPEASPRG